MLATDAEGRAVFEVVHTVTDWHDGPRHGIADFRGSPHVFELGWNDLADEYADFYLLAPIDAETLALALEAQAIWRRWVTAFRRGETPRTTHPALPEDRQRHEELVWALHGRLNVFAARAMRRRAEFRPRSDPSWGGLGWAPLEVRWFGPSKPETV